VPYPVVSVVNSPGVGVVASNSNKAAFVDSCKRILNVSMLSAAAAFAICANPALAIIAADASERNATQSLFAPPGLTVEHFIN
jgi:hypothetical protein